MISMYRWRLLFPLLLVTLVLPHATYAVSAKIPPLPPAATTTQTWSFDRSNLDVPIGTEAMEDVGFDPDNAINQYRVANDRLYKNDRWTPYHADDEQKVWDIFHAIAGKDLIKKYVAVYVTYKIPAEPILGFVVKGGSKEPSWGLAINTNASNFSDKIWTRDIAIVLVHEYAHLLTLNSAQLNINPRDTTVCEKQGGFLGGAAGCSKSGSYYGAFVGKFWSTDARRASERAQKKGVDNSLYAAHKDDFVTKYATTNPREDIAESFTDFVLRSKPVNGTLIKDQKILFFYDYPELVTLRDSIRAVIGKYII